MLLLSFHLVVIVNAWRVLFRIRPGTTINAYRCVCVLIGLISWLEEWKQQREKRDIEFEKTRRFFIRLSSLWQILIKEILIEIVSNVCWPEECTNSGIYPCLFIS